LSPEKSHRKIRRHGKVHELPEEIRREVDDLLVEPGITYEDIAAYLKKKGYDISRSSIGRYGKEYLDTYQQLRIVEDQARTLVSEAGDGLVLEEAGAKLFAKKIVQLLMEEDVDIQKIPKLLMGFAALQRSSVSREKMKADIQKKISRTAEEVTEAVKSKGLSDAAAEEIRKKILGITA